MVGIDHPGRGMLMRSRWWAAAAAGLSLTLVASGCGNGEDSDAQVEVFSWWTGGGEEAGLNALIEVFEEENEGVEFVNAAVAVGSTTTPPPTVWWGWTPGSPRW